MWMCVWREIDFLVYDAATKYSVEFSFFSSSLAATADVSTTQFPTLLQA